MFQVSTRHLLSGHQQGDVTIWTGFLFRIKKRQTIHPKEGGFGSDFSDLLVGSGKSEDERFENGGNGGRTQEITTSFVLDTLNVYRQTATRDDTTRIDTNGEPVHEISSHVLTFIDLAQCFIQG